ncbi:N(4)-(beta-N-acetylglucosaminyl)-L-asparaginase [bacterium]|nr:N(4)-(beta-N-acetylglucosaminyl)-L-asparaginase [bacterium]
MRKKISRRGFFNQSIGFGLGSLLFKNFSRYKSDPSSQIPLIISSHTNDTGKKAVEKGWEILSGGGSALDAVEKAANVIELDPEGLGVGWGGLPNENGVIQLDASIMDGKTYNAGAVGALENIRTPCSVARVVMEHTDHIFLVGGDALSFAKKWGFKPQELLTEKSREIWLRWKKKLNEQDDWGPPEHLKDRNKKSMSNPDSLPRLSGTTNVLAVDKNGDVAGITTTSGLSFKIPGRVGDSPIIGAGLYVDNAVGAAGATGRGEDVIKSCASHYIVIMMKEGKSPQQACEAACMMIAEKYKNVNIDFLPGENFVAINKKGELGCARMPRKRPARVSLRNQSGYSVYKGSAPFGS